MPATPDYVLKLYVPEGTEPAQRQMAQRLFRGALEEALGDPSLVVPVYRAYLAILTQYGESPDPETLTLEESMVLEHWQQAESAALEAVFGPHRHLDEGGYEIVLPA